MLKTFLNSLLRLELGFNSKFVERVPKHRLSVVVEVVGFVTNAQKRIAIISLYTIRSFCSLIGDIPVISGNISCPKPLPGGEHVYGIVMSREWVCPGGGGYVWGLGISRRWVATQHPLPTILPPHSILVQFRTDLTFGSGVDTDTDASHQCHRYSFQKTTRASTLESMLTLGV